LKKFELKNYNNKNCLKNIVTVELIRKRAEHNEGEIRSLEELALHQEKLEKIEIVDRICRKLKILLLQNNAISKIGYFNVYYNNTSYDYIFISFVNHLYRKRKPLERTGVFKLSIEFRGKS